ncbi:MAG TPA: hypothetical protein VJX66_07465 [Amycolatopsis sp.]|nr:hypothetical protein [Amycolatopsis sp.]
MLPTAEVADAHRTLYAVLDSLTDDQVADGFDVTVIGGSPQDLVAWLSGRTAGGRLTGDLPELGHWPGSRPPAS